MTDVYADDEFGFGDEMTAEQLTEMDCIEREAFFFPIRFIVLKDNYPMLHINCCQRQKAEVYLGYNPVQNQMETYKSRLGSLALPLCGGSLRDRTFPVRVIHTPH